MSKSKKNFFSSLVFFTSIICFILIQILIHKYHHNIFSNNEIDKEIMVKDINIINKEINNENYKENENSQSVYWQLEIPSINLIGDIKEGTDKKTLNTYIGHFIETQKIYGNVGLAAHNRGYEMNYFARIKELKEGDIIIYRYNNFEKNYEVTKCKIIKDTDWDVLENTEENMITLITCVENEPEYRRCIQAEEIVENN